MLDFVKAHAYGNDFLYVREDEVRPGEGPAMAQVLCDRHAGAGADGLILFRMTAEGAAMHLFNADGSFSEVSGNGVRGLAAILARQRGLRPGSPERGPSVTIETDAGVKVLSLLDQAGDRLVFRAAMGLPTDISLSQIDVAGELVEAVTLRVGNPQCVVLEPLLDEKRYQRLGPLLAHHAAFPEGTNVEFAHVEAPDRVRILIWERGVGPTLASGTGACAAGVAAMARGGAARSLEVHSPGGTQRVEWTEGGLFLTGWAEVLYEGRWKG
jgi:diaminopimelate epimerase